MIQSGNMLSDWWSILSPEVKIDYLIKNADELADNCISSPKVKELHDLMILSNNRGIKPEQFCSLYSELWNTYPDIIDHFTYSVQCEIAAKEMDDSQYDLLLEHLSDTNAKKILCKQADNTFILMHPQSIPYVTSEALVSFLSDLKWDCGDTDYVSRVTKVLSQIDSQKYPETVEAMQVALSDKVFSTWWDCLKDDVKITILGNLENAVGRESFAQAEEICRLMEYCLTDRRMAATPAWIRFIDLYFDEWTTHPSKFDLLLERLSDTSAKKTLCRKADNTFILMHPQSIPYVPSEALLRFISDVKWDCGDTDYVSRVTKVLSQIDSQKYPDAAKVLHVSLSDKVFSTWWDCLKDEIKITILGNLENPVDWEASSRSEEIHHLMEYCLSDERMTSTPTGIRFIAFYSDDWVAHPKMISGLRNNILECLQKEALLGSAAVNALLSYLPDESKTVFCANVDHSFIRSYPACVPYLKEKTFISYIQSIDWKNMEPDHISTEGAILGQIEADLSEQAALEVAKGLFDAGVAFSDWWKVLRESVKVRILIYCSNYPETLKQWKKDCQRIYLYEKEEKHALIVVLFGFCNLYFLVNPAGKNEAFLNAHKNLMDYIKENFNAGIGVTRAMNTLLNKCDIYEPGGEIYFCDARALPANPEKGFLFAEMHCPAGNARKYAKGHCKFFKKPLETRACRTGDLKYQNLTDFIRNLGFELDLSSIGISNPQEYGYRIAGFVDRLIDMYPHMHCTKCGASFSPKFEYARSLVAVLSLNRYSCPNAKGDFDENHDTDIYLNFCHGCHRVIDSRECKKKYMGMHVCMRCGDAGPSTRPGMICPSCGKLIPEDARFDRMNKFVYCPDCGYSGGVFSSAFEKENRD